MRLSPALSRMGFSWPRCGGRGGGGGGEGAPDLCSPQDPAASFDVNDQDSDPQPRYTQMNDNRWGPFWGSGWEQGGGPEWSRLWGGEGASPSSPLRSAHLALHAEKNGASRPVLAPSPAVHGGRTPVPLAGLSLCPPQAWHAVCRGSGRGGKQWHLWRGSGIQRQDWR